MTNLCFRTQECSGINRLVICLHLFFHVTYSPFISDDALSTCAVHSSTFGTDISMLRKAKGREFILEAPFRLLAGCSEMPVVPSHFVWMIYWSIQPSRLYSTLFLYGTYTIFCVKCNERVQPIMHCLLWFFFLASSKPMLIQNARHFWKLPAACGTLAFFSPPCL